MDSSGHDQQSSSLKHALGGVQIEELSPQERVDVLRHLLKTYISGWGGNPPGFRPYMTPMKKNEWDVRLRGSIKSNVRTLELTPLPHLEVKRGFRGMKIGREVRLLVADDGTLLLEVMYYLVDDPSSGPHYRLKLCTDHKIWLLLSEPHVMGWIVSNLKRGLTGRKQTAQHQIDMADAKLRIFERVS